MAEINDEKLKMMEDEMNRFEEEIGLPNFPVLAQIRTEHHRTVIGANTYNQVQEQLDKQLETVPEPMIQARPQIIAPQMRMVPPPPPPPPTMFIPAQVQRGPGPPLVSMEGSGGAPVNMNFGPGPGPIGYGPLRFGPQGHNGPPIGPPGNIGPGGPMQIGPIPGSIGPGGPGHMGHGGMGPNGPGPMGQMMGPHIGGPGPMMPSHFQGQLPSGPPGPMMPPGFMPPPPPEFLGQMSNHLQNQGPVVLSATPKLYLAKGCEEIPKAPTVGPEYPMQPIETYHDKKNNRFTKPFGAKEMAEKVKTTTIVSIMQDSSSGQQPKKKEKKNKKMIRTAGGQTWEDSSLMEWEDDDFRLFCGDLGNDVTDEVLTRAFSKYTSFLKARVVRDKRTNKTKGFGFVSFKDPQDFIRATKEMNGRYVGSRPIKLRKSTWKNRSIDVVRKKDKEKTALISLLTGRS